MAKKYLFFLIVSCSIIYFLYHYSPVLENMPQPNGIYAIGNVKYFVEDKKEQLLQKPRNRCNLDVFYPIKIERKKTNLYQEKKIAAFKAIKGNSFFKKLFWDWALRPVYTYTQPNVIISKIGAPYPIILFLPGIGGVNLYNSYLEELASHGFVVCAIEPPYDTYITVFPNEEIILLDPILEKAIREQNRTAIYDYRNQAHERWKIYVEYALKKLKELDDTPESPFYNMLNLESMGLLGHSHGGAVVIDLCQNSDQYKAGINMDGWTKTYNTANKVRVPFLFLSNKDGYMPEMEQFFKNNQQDSFKKNIISGASHGAFGDSFKFPLPQLLGIVTKSTSLVRSEINKFLVSFFNAYLKEEVKT
jgi:hypothetical protein